MANEQSRPGWEPGEQAGTWELRDGAFIADVDPEHICVHLVLEGWGAAKARVESRYGSLAEDQIRAEEMIADVRLQVSSDD
jgi:hypothetical protein